MTKDIKLIAESLIAQSLKESDDSSIPDADKIYTGFGKEWHRRFHPELYQSGLTRGCTLEPGRTYKIHSSDGDPVQGSPFTVMSKLGPINPMGHVTYKVRYSDGRLEDYEDHPINVYHVIS
jgi:hypothetical protein